MRDFPSSLRFVRFGAFEVDLRAGELRKRGVRIRVQGQPFLLLVTLLKHDGEVVTREELRRTLWPEDTFVDFDHSLGAAINKLRQALGDSASNPRFIETLARRGYRFIAPVDPVTDVPETAAGNASPVQEQLSPTTLEDSASPLGPITEVPALVPRRKPWRAYLAVALLFMAGMTVWFFMSDRFTSSIRSLAVLPLDNVSGDPAQDYFSDGMTDELITQLSQWRELRVISRTSVMTYKGDRKPLPAIARELNVDAVVEGTVLRSGNQVRITAQLIRASSDTHLWAHSYEIELRDILAAQRQVAQDIAGEIRLRLAPAGREERIKTVNTEAYEAYLKGRYFWNKRTADGLRNAIEYFKRSIEKDPAFAPAYAGLADSYALSGDWEYGILAPTEAYPKAKAAAAKAVELDNNLGEAHISLAFVLDGFDWNFVAADKEFQKGLELSPGYATGHQWYAGHLLLFGRHDEAIAEMKKAENLDPLSLIIGADLAEDLLIAHKYDEAIEQARKTIAMDPNFALAHYQLGAAFVQNHRYNDGVEELRRAVHLSGGSTAAASCLAYAYGLSGRKAEAEAILNDLQNRSIEGFSNAPEIGLVYVGLHQSDQAMDWLEKGYAERFNPGVLMRPGFDPIRSDPRFQNLLHRIGLR